MNTQHQNIPETLPLFPFDAGTELNADRRTDGRTTIGQRIVPRKRRSGVDGGYGGYDCVNPHLLAARKLSRKIKYLPDHSEAQAQTAQAICQHLRLLLAAAESAD